MTKRMDGTGNWGRSHPTASTQLLVAIVLLMISILLSMVSPYVPADLRVSLRIVGMLLLLASMFCIGHYVGYRAGKTAGSARAPPLDKEKGVP
jgi:hypothetical protein